MDIIHLVIAIALLLIFCCWTAYRIGCSVVIRKYAWVLVLLIASGTLVTLLFSIYWYGLAVWLYLLFLWVRIGPDAELPLETNRFLVFLTVLSVLVNLCFWGLRNLDTKKAKLNPREEQVADFFETIREDEAALTAFFQAMPKGGDLHNHYSGSIYAESYLDFAIANACWIHPQTLKIYADSLGMQPGSQRLDTLSKKESFGLLRRRIYQEWSAKDYYESFRPSDQHFFDAFAKFPKERTWSDTKRGMQELLDRAVAENIQYLELMIGGASYKINRKEAKERLAQSDSMVRMAIQTNRVDTIDSVFNRWYEEFSKTGFDSVTVFIDSLSKMYDKLDRSKCELRYLLQGKRESTPAEVFRGLVLAFMAADRSPIIVGVNIVNREDGPLSMRDYRLHMEMFRFLRGKFKNVQYSMHAGELVLGLVKPEDLTWHIRDALYIAGAKRIGHGVDIMHEKDQQGILSFMKRKKIPVEINLVSNEFILKVKDSRHPIMTYFQAGVPIVISSDDAGILRTNMTEQFVVLAKRYKGISYPDIKSFIRNSIEFSFIKEEKMKQQMLMSLEEQLLEFEKSILKK